QHDSPRLRLRQPDRLRLASTQGGDCLTLIVPSANGHPHGGRFQDSASVGQAGRPNGATFGRPKMKKFAAALAILSSLVLSFSDARAEGIAYFVDYNAGTDAMDLAIDQWALAHLSANILKTSNDSTFAT